MTASEQNELETNVQVSPDGHARVVLRGRLDAQTAVAQVKQVGVTLVASLKSARSFADLKAALSKAVADTKAIADAFKAAATPIVQAAVAQIQVLITAAMPNVAALNAQVKEKVMEIINGLKQYFPVVPKVA